MNKKVLTTLLLALISSFEWVTYPAIAGVGQEMAKCTSHPCPNTRTGEEPGLVEARKGRKMEDELRSAPNDKERWSNLILFSSSTDKKSLQIPIIAASNFDISLEPKKGLLTFSTPNNPNRSKFPNPRRT